jgi:hypothetical protein
MTAPNTSELVPLLEQAAQEGSAEGRAILESALEVLPGEGEVTPDGTPFEVQVLLNARGTIAVATTRKVPNLRFRLGEVLVEVVGYGIGLPGKLQNPIAAVLSTLSFLRSLNKLATISLDSGDAELLITIFRLTRDREVLSLDALSSATSELQEPQRIAALERLERLACITLGEGTVQMNETIIVQRA